MIDYSLKVVKPVRLTSAMLVSSTVPETDHAEWSAGTTYGDGQRVIIAAENLVYESVAATNLNHPPATSQSWWKVVGPTNRWKVFDTSNSTQTAQPLSMSYTLKPGIALGTFGVLNLVGVTSLRVRLVDGVYGTVYDKFIDLSGLPEVTGWWHWFFGARTAATLSVLTDLPAFPTANLVVDITGTTELAVGVMIFGQTVPIGNGVEYGARVGIQDYSRKETNEYGDSVLVQRAYAKRANFDMKVERNKVDTVQNLLAGLRAVPCLWIGSSMYESTIVYGFYKDFDLNIAYPDYANCSLEIEGLT